MRKLFRNSVLTLIALFSFQSYAQRKAVEILTTLGQEI